MIPIKVRNLVPLNTDRHQTEKAYKNILHNSSDHMNTSSGQIYLEGEIPKNYVVKKEDHLRIKPSIEHRDNPFLEERERKKSGGVSSSENTTPRPT